MKKINLIFLIFFLIIIFFYIFYKQGSLPVNKNSTKTKIFVILPGQPLQKIIDNLAKEELIRSKIIFYLIVKQLGIEKKIQAGDFRLSASMNAYQIAENLTHGTLDIWVTLIEGTRVEEMAKVLSKKFDIEEIEFIKKAQEGYMFPDTYLIPKNANVDIIIKILKNNYKNKVNQEIIKKAQKKGLTEKELIILASIVEKEAKKSRDKQIVASILLKRLKNNWPLQVDATIQYALGYQINEKTWWKKYLTYDDLKINSDYNTYINKGLPPTPICNPGIISIEAVANADINTPYWYYISDSQGKNMHYATTLKEHEENIEKYLR
ncbi:MAG: endolytic transglycosylase MltG [Patescibacteria group bacterium]|nr:endolytic transglycosylase MltG [Patescibacteria group bacterium]